MTAHPTGSTTLRQMVPIRAWLHTPILRRRASLMFALFAGYPLMAGWLISHQFQAVTANPDGTLDAAGAHALAHDLNWLDWPFVAYFGAAWLVGMWLIVRPRLTIAQGAIIAVVALVVEGPVAIWLETTFNAKTTNIFSSILAIGGSEELAKQIPLLLAVSIALSSGAPRMRQWLDLSPRSYLFLGCLSGVVFGCSEAVEYIVNTQHGILSGQDDVFGLTEVVFLRLITDPINHALWAGVAAFFLGLAVQRMRQSNRTGLGVLVEQSWLILTGIAIAATLHGINDFVATNAAAEALVDAVSALLLLGYAVAGDIVENAVASAPTPSWVPSSWQPQS